MLQTGYKSYLTKKLVTGGNEIEVAIAPSVTRGRMLIRKGNTKEWIKYTGVTGLKLTGVVRQLSTTADPSISLGDGFEWPAGTEITLVAMHDQQIDKTEEGDLQFQIDEINDELLLKANNCNVVTKSADYEFDGTEENNTGFSTSTAGGDVTYTLDPSLFPTDNGLFEFIICKSTSDSNKVIIDVGTGNLIDLAQTYELKNHWETATIKVVNSTFVKIVATSNKASNVDISSLGEVITPKGEYVLATPTGNKKISETSLLRSNIEKFTLGEAMSVGDAFYIDGSNGKIYKTSASNTSKLDFKGFVREAGIVDDEVLCDIGGVSDTKSGLTIGSNYYLGVAPTLTPFSITQTSADTNRFVGADTSSYIQGQTFTISGGPLKINSITLGLFKYGTPTDNVRVKIQATNGAIIGTSQSISGTTLTTTPTDYTFNFSNVILSTGVYGFIIERDGSVSGSNFYGVRHFQSYSVYSGGNQFTMDNSGVITNQTTQDLYFTINGVITITGITTSAGVPYGANVVLIGTAVSTTGIFINKILNKKIITGTRDLSSSSGTITYNHGLGKIPNSIEINSITGASGVIYPLSISYGGYINYSNISTIFSNNIAPFQSNIYSILGQGTSSTQYQTGIIQNITENTFDILWTKYSTPTSILCFTAIIS